MTQPYIGQVFATETAKFTVKALKGTNTSKTGYVPKIEPKQSKEFEAGAILVSSWGYDQTNVDFYCVLSMSKCGNWCTIAEMTKITTSDGIGTHSAREMPNEIKDGTKGIRRKIQRPTYQGGEPYAKHGYEFLRLWNGKPQRSSSYA